MKDFIEYILGSNLDEITGGSISLGVSLPPFLITGTIVLILTGVWLFYRRTTVPVSPRLKWLLISLKSIALVLFFLCLLRPMAIHSVSVPQKNYLAIVVDDSRSMTIKDKSGAQSRKDVAAELVYGEGGMIDRLQDNFELQIFRFDKGAAPIKGKEKLTASGPRTHLHQSLDLVTKEIKGMSPAGLILITDGADNGIENPLRYAGIATFPIFTVGIGQESVHKDIEIANVSTHKTILEGAIVEVNVSVRSQGYADREVDLRIKQGDYEITSKRIALSNTDHVRRYTLEMTPEKEGPQVYTVMIPEQAGEIITENNRWSFLVDNSQKRLNILYIEGHPRNEYKFIRRAVEIDQTLRLVSYLQSGPQQFLRQGVETPEELASGFPKREEDLFRYQAIIFGDIPKHFFTKDQLDLTRKFVSKRGGGFLMTGGSTAFDAAYLNTPVADLLPVTLIPEKQLPPRLRGGAGKGDHPTGEKYPIKLTEDGEQAPQLRLGPLGDKNNQWWNKMPDLQGIHATGRVKPGATVLATHPRLQFRNEPLPVIAYQRYGRGRTMAITTASTWRWQMLMPHEDTSHERFWRQLLRWLASSSQKRLDLRLDRNTYSPGDDVFAQVRVLDSAFNPVNDATVVLDVTAPDGVHRDIRLKRSMEKDGVYVGNFAVKKEGVFQVDISSETAKGDISESSTWFLVTTAHAEYVDAGMNADLLKRMAKTSGGKFYTAQNAHEFVEDSKALQKTISVKIEQDIWNIPLVLVFLITVLGLEWALRRQKGMS